MQKLIVLILACIFSITGVCHAETYLEATTGTAVYKMLKINNKPARFKGLLYGLRGINYTNLGGIIIRTEADISASDAEETTIETINADLTEKSIALRAAIAFEGDDKTGFYFGPVFKKSWLDSKIALKNTPVTAKASAETEELYISESFILRGTSGNHLLEFIAEVYVPIDGDIKSEFKTSMGSYNKEDEHLDIGLGYGVELRYGYKRFTTSVTYRVYEISEGNNHFATFNIGVVL